MESGKVRADAMDDSVRTPPPTPPSLLPRERERAPLPTPPSLLHEEREDGEHARCHAEKDYIELCYGQVHSTRRYSASHRCCQRGGECLLDQEAVDQAGNSTARFRGAAKTSTRGCWTVRSPC